MRSRLPRGSQPQSRTERASTSSTSYSSRSRSPISTNASRTTNGSATNPTMTTPILLQHQSDSPSTPDTYQMPPSQWGHMPANSPNGSNASQTGGPYSTPRTMG